jgi:hypothetical protein
MIEIFHKLLAGNGDLARQFAEARKYWENFFEKNENLSNADLAKAVTGAQMDIEQIFEMNRVLGKEAMPFTCFGTLYGDSGPGWRDRERRLACRMVRAFKESMVSLEVKEDAERAARLYYVEDPVAGFLRHSLGRN